MTVSVVECDARPTAAFTVTVKVPDTVVWIVSCELACATQSTETLVGLRETVTVEEEALAERATVPAKKLMESTITVTPCVPPAGMLILVTFVRTSKPGEEDFGGLP